MMLWPRKRFLLGLMALISVSTATSVVAQANTPAYPTRPVRMIVSYAAGNVTDTLARVVGERLSAKWGQPVTIDNKPGQGGSLGARTAAKATADGYTLLFSALAAMAINPHVYSDVGYDVDKDFVPIVRVAYPDLLLAITPGLKIDSLPKLVEYSKSHPTAINYGTAGNGTVPHLNMEQLKTRTGLVAQHVPYKAAAAVLADLIGGRVQLQMEGSAVLLPQVKAGKVVAIAVAPSRHSQLPNVPTLSELYSGYEPVIPWLGIFALTNTPPTIIDKINRDVREILEQPDVVKQLDGYGLTAAPNSQADFAATVKKDSDRLGALLRTMNLKVD